MSRRSTVGTSGLRAGEDVRTDKWAVWTPATFLPTLIGGLIGSSTESLVGILVCMLLGFLIGGYFQQRQRWLELMARLEAASLPYGSGAVSPKPVSDARASDTAPAVPPPAVAPVASSDSAYAPQSPLLPPDWGTLPHTLDKSSRASATRSSDTPVEAWGNPTPTNPLQSLYDRGMAFFTGGNWLVRVGVIVLLCGVAFLLRHAAMHGWIPLEVRLLAIAAGGIVLLGLGWHWRQRHYGYGLALQGGGIGVLYLTIYAAFLLYSVLSPLIAGISFVACAALAIGLALRQDAHILAVLGTLGGLSAPVLAAPYSLDTPAWVIGYYLILNASIAVIAYFKAWRLLNLIGFIGTFGVATVWAVQFYQPIYIWVAECFLVLSVLLYVAIAIFFSWRQPVNLKGYIDGTLVFGTPFMTLSLQAIFMADVTYGLAVSALLLGIFYLTLSGLLRHTLTTLAEAFCAIGLVLMAFAVVMSADARTTSAFYALQGMALVWIGCRQQRMWSRVMGGLLQVAAGFAYGSAPWPYDLWPLLNADFLGIALLTGAGLGSGLFLHRAHNHLYRWETMLPTLWLVWSFGWWSYGGLADIDLRVDGALRFGVTVVYFSVTAWIASQLAARLAWPLLDYPALALLPVLMAILIGYWYWLDQPAALGGWFAWPIAMLLYYRILYEVERRFVGL